MDLSEYLEMIKTQEIDEKKVLEIEKLYNFKLPIIVKKILSANKETMFLSNEHRILSYNEVLNAQKQLHINFSIVGLIPLIDCYDNNFIVYNSNKDNWCMYNIIDECIFETQKYITDFDD